MRLTPARASARGTAYARSTFQPAVSPILVPLNHAWSSSSSQPALSTRSPCRSASVSVTSPTYHAMPSVPAARPFPSQRPGTRVGDSVTPATERAGESEGAPCIATKALAKRATTAAAEAIMPEFYRSAPPRFATLRP